MMYEPPKPKPAPPREVLRKHLDSVVERIAQIDLLLQTDAQHKPEQTQGNLEQNPLSVISGLA
jgi:hypothetical protein